MFTNVLTQIKNAQQAKREKLKVPYSQMDMAILETLVRFGYLEAAVKKGRAPKKIIEIKIKYDDGKGVINDVKFVSKPSRRIYIGYKNIRTVKQGYGLGIISTSDGIMATHEAKKKKIGGQVLFEIW